MDESGVEQRRDAVIEQIRRAFAGVSRAGGVSLHEAAVIEAYGSGVERAQARLLDRDTDWQEIRDEDIENYDGVVFHFDPIGLRYHLPAYMIWSLRNYATSDSMSVDTTIFMLHIGGEDSGNYHMERYALMDQDQSRAIAAFLWFMVESTGDTGYDYGACTALEAYWERFLGD